MRFTKHAGFRAIVSAQSSLSDCLISLWRHVSNVPDLPSVAGEAVKTLDLEWTGLIGTLETCRHKLMGQSLTNHALSRTRSVSTYLNLLTGTSALDFLGILRYSAAPL